MPGEIQIITLPKGIEFELFNPYESDLVNYLQFWIRTSPNETKSVSLILDFDLARNKNKLVNIVNASERFLKVSIGQFTGREEALYTLNDFNNGVFVFVIEGAFEVQGRLLHPRNGLALWDVEESVDLEALSNEAIIVLVEMRK